MYLQHSSCVSETQKNKGTVARDVLCLNEEEKMVRRYNVHVRFVHVLTSKRCFDPVTIDQGGILSQLGGLTVTMGWTTCYWVRGMERVPSGSKSKRASHCAMRASTLIHASVSSIWGIRLGWMGRMRAYRPMHAHWSMLVCYPYGGFKLGWLGRMHAHWSMCAHWSMHAHWSMCAHWSMLVCYPYSGLG